jgi:uncharacterized protein (DUF342 family)
MHISISGKTSDQAAIYGVLNERFLKVKNEIKLLEGEKKTLLNYLRTHGEGEVAVLKKVYPGTMIEIKRIIKEISSTALSTRFYVQEGQMREI